MEQTISVTRSSMPPFEEYVEEIKSIWDSRWLTNFGSKHEELTLKLCEYLGVCNLALFVNGHSALEGMLEVFDLRGEVITTPFTFTSTTNAIMRKGLKPVFCDIDPDDYTIDVDKIENCITENTCAIMPVHVYGNVCDVDRIQEIADKHHLKVLYDAAHAFGVKRNGVDVCNYGDASMLSFHATKVFHTIEGGAVVYHDPSLKDAYKQCRDFGIVGPECVHYAGGNAKMTEFSAAMGLCNLRHIDEQIAKRKVVVETYRELLGNIPGIQLNAIQDDVQSNYAYFPIVVHPEEFRATRDDVFQALAEKGIGARKYFYPLTSSMDVLQGVCSPDDTPVAQRIAQRVLTLPLYADLTTEETERIAGTIAGLYRK